MLSNQSLHLNLEVRAGKVEDTTEGDLEAGVGKENDMTEGDFRYSEK